MTSKALGPALVAALTPDEALVLKMALRWMTPEGPDPYGKGMLPFFTVGAAVAALSVALSDGTELSDRGKAAAATALEKVM